MFYLLIKAQHTLHSVAVKYAYYLYILTKKFIVYSCSYLLLYTYIKININVLAEQQKHKMHACCITGVIYKGTKKMGIYMRFGYTAKHSKAGVH